MLNHRGKYAAVWLTVVASIVVGLSVLFGIPYIYSIIGLATWIFGGHLITLDDDMPGEWSNPEKSKKLWHQSILELFAKLGILLGLLALTVIFPTIKSFGT